MGPSEPDSSSRSLTELASTQGQTDRGLIATLLVLVILFPISLETGAYLKAAAIAGCLFQAVRREPLFWVGISAALGASIALNWTFADNHHYLGLYWTLAIAVALCLPPNLQWKSLGQQGRWLLVIVMLFATGWKLSNPEYRSGAFFEYTLLTDDRFAPKVTRFSGITAEQLQENRNTLPRLRQQGHQSPDTPHAIPLHTNPAVRQAAFALTWLTVLYEGLLGLVFLIPIRSRHWSLFQDTSLLLFLCGTYLIAPVLGFGGLLAVIGATHTPSPIRRNLFFASLVLLQLYEITFYEVLAG